MTAMPHQDPTRESTLEVLDTAKKKHGPVRTGFNGGSVKTMLTIGRKSYDELEKIMLTKDITIQELIRVIIIPHYLECRNK